MVQGDNQQATPSEAEIAWLSGIIEGEGTLAMGAHARKEGGKPKITVSVRIYNTDAGIIRKCIEILDKIGVGHYLIEKELGPALKISGKEYKARDPVLDLRVKKFQDALTVLLYIRPWLFGNKQHRAELMLQFLKHRLQRIEIEGNGNTRLPFNNEDLQPVKEFYKLTRVKRNRELERVLND